MVQILPQEPGLGGYLGEGLGQGLSSGLQYLLQAKIGEKQNRLAMQRDAAKQQAKEETLMRLLGPSQSFSEEEISGPQGSAMVEEESGPNERQILAASLADPNLGRLLQGQQESKIRQREKVAGREWDRAKDVFKRADERAEALPVKENALATMKDALVDGNLGFFSPDNIAEITGVEAFRTPKGAQFITSGKEFFLGSLKRAGARPNQWIEQQLLKMLPKIGRSPEANLTVVAALESELAIEEAYGDILQKLEEEDMSKFGHVKGNIGQRANKELRVFANAEQKKLEENLREIQGVTKKGVKMTDPDGNTYLVPKSDIKDAEKAGYKRKK